MKLFLLKPLSIAVGLYAVLIMGCTSQTQTEARTEIKPAQTLRIAEYNPDSDGQVYFLDQAGVRTLRRNLDRWFNGEPTAANLQSMALALDATPTLNGMLSLDVFSVIRTAPQETLISEALELAISQHSKLIIEYSEYLAGMEQRLAAFDEQVDGSLIPGLNYRGDEYGSFEVFYNIRESYRKARRFLPLINQQHRTSSLITSPVVHRFAELGALESDDGGSSLSCASRFGVSAPTPELTILLGESDSNSEPKVCYFGYIGNPGHLDEGKAQLYEMFEERVPAEHLEQFIELSLDVAKTNHRLAENIQVYQQAKYGNALALNEIAEWMFSSMYLHYYGELSQLMYLIVAHQSDWEEWAEGYPSVIAKWEQDGAAVMQEELQRAIYIDDTDVITSYAASTVALSTNGEVSVPPDALAVYITSADDNYLIDLSEHPNESEIVISTPVYMTLDRLLWM
uniref:hypothetical protein n=1 Tax=Thaumasiovibrio occultus TaxID=1891184 RepID=UPI000B351CA3|nr:hypothetical protein [Thaumasiovibrio occultus]